MGGAEEEPPGGPDTGDGDYDGLPNWLELYYGTDPYSPDTDTDMASDGDEIFMIGTDPLNWDSNANGYGDYDDFYYNTYGYYPWDQPTPLAIYTFDVPNGQVGAGYNATIGATGGVGYFTWSLNSDNWPTGITTSEEFYGTGGFLHLSGIPWETGSYSFTIDISDGLSFASASYSFEIIAAAGTEPSPPLIFTPDTPSLAIGEVGVPYSSTIEVTGGTGDYYTWSMYPDQLPSGMSWHTDTAGHFYLSGTPAQSGYWSFTLEASDANGQSGSQNFVLEIAEAPQFNSYSIPPGQVGISYNASIGVDGGIGPYTWYLNEADLPDGITWATDNYGLYLQGTPTQSGLSTFEVGAVDSLGAHVMQYLELDIAPSSEPEPDPNADWDGDGVTDAIESAIGSSPWQWDSIMPGLSDWFYFYAYGPASTDVDADGDGLGAILEAALGTQDTTWNTHNDFRGDWWVYYQVVIAPAENFMGFITDDDGDALSNNLEYFLGMSDSSTDSDGDGLSDVYEWENIADSCPWLWDTDGDGLEDGLEHSIGTHARNVDSDGDHLTDQEEYMQVYGPLSPLHWSTANDGIPDYYLADLTDTDGGGIPDRLETFWGLIPDNELDEDGDIDADGISNLDEYLTGYDIWGGWRETLDWDNDGMTNVFEISSGLDPNDPHDGADDPDGDYLTNLEESGRYTSPWHLLTPGFEDRQIADLDLAGEAQFDSQGQLRMRLVLNDYEATTLNELVLNPSGRPALVRGNGPLSNHEWEDDWDQDGLSNYEELYPSSPSARPSDPRFYTFAPLVITTPGDLGSFYAGSTIDLYFANAGGPGEYDGWGADDLLPSWLELGPNGNLFGTIPPDHEDEELVFDVSVMSYPYTYTPDTYAATATFRLQILAAPLAGPGELPGEGPPIEDPPIEDPPIDPPDPLTITHSSPYSGEEGQPYSYTFQATGGVPVYSWEYAGFLPAGLGFGGGSLSGTPEEDGSFEFTVYVTDSQGVMDQKNVFLVIHPQGDPSDPDPEPGPGSHLEVAITLEHAAFVLKEGGQYKIGSRKKEGGTVDPNWSGLFTPHPTATGQTPPPPTISGRVNVSMKTIGQPVNATPPTGATAQLFFNGFPVGVPVPLTNITTAQGHTHVYTDIPVPTELPSVTYRNVELFVTSTGGQKDGKPLAPQPSTSATVSLRTMEVKVVNRDDPAKTWTTGPVTSGPLAYTSPTISEVSDVKNGDLISWSLPGLTGGSFQWWATGPSGSRKDAPSSVTTNEWKLEDPLDWIPGKWRIHCRYTPSGGAATEFDFEQKLGYRSPDITVIGWIDGAQIILPSGADKPLLRTWPSGTYPSPLSVETWMGTLPTRMTFLGEVALGDVYTVPLAPDPARKYVNAYLIKSSPNNEPPAEFQLPWPGFENRKIVDDAGFNQFKSQTDKFRSFHRFQARFELDDSGKIKGSPHYLKQATLVGVTPVDWLPDPAGETGPHDGTVNTTGASIKFNPKNGKTHSAKLADDFEQYTQGRISTSGMMSGGHISQQINNLKVPWIWSLIEFGAAHAKAGSTATPEHEIFPVYHVYYNGKRIDTLTNSISEAKMEEFIQLGEPNVP